MKVKTLNYTAVFQKEPEGGYTVYIPVLPGCVTYGKDLSDAKIKIQGAIELYLESMDQHNEIVPNEGEVFYSQLNIDYPKFHPAHA